MLNLPRTTLVKVKRYLLRQQKNVEQQLQAIEADDPTSVVNSMIAESSEPGTDSWLADVHGRLSTLRGDLLDLSSRIKVSLLKIKRGTYGKCEQCGKAIEPERLEAMPTATLCVSCSIKASKKGK